MKRIDGRALALALVDVCTGALFREKCPYKEFRRGLHQQEPRSKKNSMKLVRTRKWDFGTEILLYVVEMYVHYKIEMLSNNIDFYYPLFLSI